MQPTGSQDPYALRRAANGIAQIIVEEAAPLTISLSALIGKSYDLLANQSQLIVNKDDVIQAVSAFLGARLENILTDAGIRYDVINAVAAAGYDDLADAYTRAVILQQYRSQPAFAELLAGFTRAANLLRNAASKKILPASLVVDEKSLVEESEKQLYALLQSVSYQIQVALVDKDYVSALTAIASLRGEIDSFFNEVMVMAPQDELRNNRLALLAQIVDLTKGIGDLSQIVD